MYTNDYTDYVPDKNPHTLQEMIQVEADLSTLWVKDNKMVCSGSKNPMFIGTQELRKSKLVNSNLKFEVNVDGCRVVESESERLLGLIINNIMTWKHHIHGNGETKGLSSTVTKSKTIKDVNNKLSISRCSFIYEGSRLYNLLPYEITTLNTVAMFQKAVKA